MKFVSLGSGSKGNATIVSSGKTNLMIDCGFGIKEASQRLGKVGLDPTKINALLLTHEHSDHVKGAGAFVRRYKTPIWATVGTIRKAKLGEIPALHYINSNVGSFQIADIKVTPYTIPHDAIEPCQYYFTANHKKMAILTDVGFITPHIIESLQNLNALLLEFNHDIDLLNKGPYPRSLKNRVAGKMGHLNNNQAALLLQEINHTGLKTLVLGHLSEQNNNPELVLQAIQRIVRSLGVTPHILGQQKPSEWFFV